MTGLQKEKSSYISGTGGFAENRCVLTGSIRALLKESSIGNLNSAFPGFQKIEFCSTLPSARG